jgi:hypothetical protein
MSSTFFTFLHFFHDTIASTINKPVMLPNHTGILYMLFLLKCLHSVLLTLSFMALLRMKKY